MTRILETVLAALLASASVVAAQATTTAQNLGPIQTLACYDTLGSIDDDGTDNTFQSSGECQKTCVAQGAKVMVTTSGSTCYCGDSLPPNTGKVDQDKCDVACGGYDLETCGGVGFYQFYLTGIGAPKIDSDSSSSSSSASSITSATSAANTATATTESATPEESSSGGGSSKIGIAVGVVVGVVGVAVIAGVGIFFYKRRRIQQLEQEHARTAAINGFVSGSKSETSSANDSRLDPSVYSHRRQSIGSIADERDFSRRILQVRNPDRDSRASHV